MMEHLTANPRFYDRLLAVCTAVMGAALLFLAVQAMQAPPGPASSEGQSTVEIRGMAQDTADTATEQVAGEYTAREPAS